MGHHGDQCEASGESAIFVFREWFVFVFRLCVFCLWYEKLAATVSGSVISMSRYLHMNERFVGRGPRFWLPFVVQAVISNHAWAGFGCSSPVWRAKEVERICIWMQISNKKLNHHYETDEIVFWPMCSSRVSSSSFSHIELLIGLKKKSWPVFRISTGYTRSPETFSSVLQTEFLGCRAYDIQ